MHRACLRQLTSKGGASAKCCSVAPLGTAEARFGGREAMALTRRTFMASEWFYTRDGKTKIGPVSSVQLQALAKSGQFRPTDMLWREGMAN